MFTTTHMKSFAAMLSICLALTSIAGCRSRPTAQFFSAPDGGPGIVITCRKLVQCYQEAGKRCPQGYAKIGEDKERPSFMDIQPSRRSNSLVVSCKRD